MSDPTCTDGELAQTLAEAALDRHGKEPPGDKAEADLLKLAVAKLHDNPGADPHGLAWLADWCRQRLAEL